jgi:tripartite-type tricarboxylate transporter receptor subunit TctC
MISPSHVINPALRADLPYDLLRDFAPIVEIVESPNVLVVNAAAPIRTVAELIAYAKARPGQINYGSGGVGTATHLAGELLCSMTGVRMNHVPYKGDAQATTDLIAGQITWKFGTILSIKSFVDAGRLRALATSGAQRVAALSNIPTVAESIPGFDATSLYGIAAPAGTPAVVIDRLNGEVQKVLRTPEFEATLAADGGTPVGGASEAFRSQLARSIEKWRRVVRDAQIKIE